MMFRTTACRQAYLAPKSRLVTSLNADLAGWRLYATSCIQCHVVILTEHLWRRR